MILDLAVIVCAIRTAQAEHEQEQVMLRTLAETMSPEAFAVFVNERQERIDRERAAAAVERRHRETCAAIRSTSFWRFGA